MESRYLLLCLAITSAFPLLARSATANDIYVESGSGDPAGTDDEPEIFIDSGSGDYVDGDKEEGSGVLDELTLGSNGPSPNMLCELPVCWCTYDNGTKVNDTETYAKPPENCDQYKASNLVMPTTTTVAPTTTTVAAKVSTTTINLPAPDIKIEINEPNGDVDIIVEYEPTTKKEEVLIPKRSTTARPKPTTARPKPTTEIKEASTEPGKEVVGEGSKNLYLGGPITEKVTPNGVYISHPGILAAIIGGAIVGLLCAILLVMFIVYRIRKKDEGSYPLNDTKPLKDYAYSKAPSREFYA